MNRLDKICEKKCQVLWGHRQITPIFLLIDGCPCSCTDQDCDDCEDYDDASKPFEKAVKRVKLLVHEESRNRGRLSGRKCGDVDDYLSEHGILVSQ